MTYKKLLVLLLTASFLLNISTLAFDVLAAPVVIDIDPDSAPNDLDTSVIITGSGFVETPLVYLGSTLLEEVTWVSEGELQAVVPWGMEPGVYTLTVENPSGEKESLADAFTVEAVLDIWLAGEINGGRIAEIAIAYKGNGTMTMYAASRAVGLFRSKDDGQTWELIYSGNAAQDLAVDPTNPERIYMHGPWSLFRSDDEGENWVAMETEFPTHQMEMQPCTGHEKPYPHPTITDKVFASYCGESTDKQAGLLVSEDAGLSWETAMQGLTDPQVTDLAFHPNNPNIMVVGTASGNIFISDDGGETWAFAAQPVDYVHSLTFNPFTPYDLWVSGSSEDREGFQGLMSSEPDYETWQEVTLPEGVDNASVVAFSEDVADRVYIFSGTGYFSDDGGGEWEAFGPDNLSWATDIEIVSGSPDDIFISDRASAVFCTQDHGDTWGLCNQGVTAVAPDELAVSVLEPTVVFGMLNETRGVYRGTEGGGSWQFMPAEGAQCVQAVEADPFIAERIFLGVQFGVRISEDGGETWLERKDFSIPAEYSECNFGVEAIRAHPNVNGLLLAGVRHWCDEYHNSDGGIYRSLDHGETWTRMVTPVNTANIVDIAFSAEDDQVAFAITERDQFLKSIDQGQTWEIVDIGINENMCATSVAVEPVSPFRVLIAGGCGDPNLFISLDEGESFEVLDPNPNPGINMRQIEFTPDGKILFAATPSGLKQSLDCGYSWLPAFGLMGEANITSLKAVSLVDRFILYVGTAGNAGGSGLSSILTNEIRGTGLIQAGVYRTTQLPWSKLLLPVFFN